MQIIISNSSEKPIYEQIVDSLKAKILAGELLSGEALPSIRALAKDLKISVITTKRAYEVLEADGFIETRPGKGSFVKEKNEYFVKEEVIRNIESKIEEALHIAKVYNIEKAEVQEVFHYLMEEEYNGK